MVITQFGRVEFDPLAVPMAASGKGEATASFASRLERLVRDDEAAQPAEQETVSRDEEPCDACDVPAPSEGRADVEREHSDLGDERASDQPSTPTEEQAATVVAQAEQPARATAVRHESAGKGTDVDLEASPRRDAVALGLAAPTATGATAVISASNAGAQPVGKVDGVTATQASASTTRAALDRLHAEMPHVAQRAVAGEAKTLGYRTLNAQAVQLNEQARDSVFKQILFKLGKDGGEMRMRLDPPELGELDLRMTVENGNTLRLSIGTERADLRDLLLSGLDQLKKQLEQSGLSVAHAEVHTQQGGSSREGHGGNDAHSAAHGEGDDESSSAPAQRTGWITAQGLDFWV